jgi:hypothetical protein
LKAAAELLEENYRRIEIKIWKEETIGNKYVPNQSCAKFGKSYSQEE